jgi:agmatine deiminase
MIVIWQIHFHHMRSWGTVETMKETPRARGFQMPAEWHPHRRCWMAWPSNVAAYLGRIEACRVTWANVARAISRFEPVVMLANDADLVTARTLCGPQVEVRRAAIDDGWFRDSGPSFVIDGLGSLLGVDWDFNGWGGRFPFVNDRAAAAAILDQEGIERVAAPLVLEGGSIHVDGEGTVIVTEECLLNPNRNPQLDRSAIEGHLRDFLSVETVIWLKGGLKDDITDGHVDQLAAFVRPGVVLALTSEDESDANHAALRENLEILQGSRDAKGRLLEVIEIPQPPAMYNQRTGSRVSLSHINYYMANGGIVLPAFGFPDHDQRVLGIFRDVFPDREVVPVPSLEIAFGGGNIHCITQQQPAAASLSVRLST